MAAKKQFLPHLSKYITGPARAIYKEARQTGGHIDSMTIFHLITGLGGRYLFRYYIDKEDQEYFKFSHDEFYRAFRSAHLILDTISSFYQTILKHGIVAVELNPGTYEFDRYLEDIIEDMCDIQAFIAYFKYTPGILEEYPWLNEQIETLEKRFNKYIKPLFLHPQITSLYRLYRLSFMYHRLYEAKRPDVAVFPLDELTDYHRVTISVN